jgi:hypothetical protein
LIELSPNKSYLLIINKYSKTSTLLLVVYLLLFNRVAISQLNLVKNSSFEKFSLPLDCNGGAFDIAGSPSFHHVVDNWYSQSSPDYFNSACVTSFYNVPLSFFGISYAKHGLAYSGIALYKDNVSGATKEYIYQDLNMPLKKDSIYCLSFFVTLADRTTIAIKSIGAYFSNTIPSYGATNYLNYIPQVQNSQGFIADTANWVEIQGCFTANGGEQYITIGNFNSNINTDTITAHSTNPLTGTGNHVSYYYIDSVTLWQNNFPTITKEISMENELNIFPNPAFSFCKISSQKVIQKISVTNITGQVMFQEFVNSKNHQLPLSHFSPGIYFIKVNYTNGLTVTKKIIVSSP